VVIRITGVGVGVLLCCVARQNPRLPLEVAAGGAAGCEPGYSKDGLKSIVLRTSKMFSTRLLPFFVREKPTGA